MNPLHLPLSLLPGPVPMWTPGHYHSEVALMPSMRPSHDRACWTVSVRPIEEELAPIERLSVDLSPPPIDANGNPTRIDALPVLVGMLARARGHAPGQSALYCVNPNTKAWLLETVHSNGSRDMSFFGPVDAGLRALAKFVPGQPAMATPPVPALASVPLTDPNATRLALAALFEARVWETA